MSDCTFFIKQKFSNYQDLENEIIKYEQFSGHKLSVKDSKKCTDGNFEFMYKVYQCSKSGIFKSKGKGLRNKNSHKSNCPFMLRVKVDKTKTFLEIGKIHLMHNHNPDVDYDEENSSNDMHLPLQTELCLSTSTEVTLNPETEQISTNERKKSDTDKERKEVANKEKEKTEIHEKEIQRKKVANKNTEEKEITDKEEGEKEVAAEGEDNKLVTKDVRSEQLSEEQKINEINISDLSLQDSYDNSEIRLFLEDSCENNVTNSSVEECYENKMAISNFEQQKESDYEVKKNKSLVEECPNFSTTDMLKDQQDMEKKNKVEDVSLQNCRNSKVDELKSVETRSRGRPRGTANTAIGLPKKKNIISYADLSLKNKLKQVLRWIDLDPQIINLVTSREFTLNYETIQPHLSNLNDSFLDEEVLIDSFSEFLEQKALRFFKIAIAKKRLKKLFMCLICNEEVIDSQKSIRCDLCLYWYHAKCLNLKLTKKIQSEDWFCTLCNKV